MRVYSPALECWYAWQEPDSFIIMDGQHDGLSSRIGGGDGGPASGYLGCEDGEVSVVG